MQERREDLVALGNRLPGIARTLLFSPLRVLSRRPPCFVSHFTEGLSAVSPTGKHSRVRTIAARPRARADRIEQGRLQEEISCELNDGRGEFVSLAAVCRVHHFAHRLQFREQR